MQERVVVIISTISIPNDQLLVSFSNSFKLPIISLHSSSLLDDSLQPPPEPPSEKKEHEPKDFDHYFKATLVPSKLLLYNHPPLAPPISHLISHNKWSSAYYIYDSNEGRSLKRQIFAF